MTDALRTDPAPKAESPSGDPRADRVRAAVRTWQRTLVDLGGRKTLLWYRDLPSCTLDLTTAHPGGVAMLLAGRRTRLSDLVREPAAFEEARRRARAIRSKALELHEERGIAAGFIAIGMATWSVPRAARPPASPVLLRSCVLRPTGAAQEDFQIDLGPEAEFNPVLREYLRSEQGIELDADALADLASAGNGFDPYPVYAALGHACERVPEFEISPRLVLGTFSYAKLPMVADLALQGEALANHDVVAALAGDESALAAVRLRLPESDPDPDPEHEYLVLDADSSQHAAIDAVRAGAHLVVKGPPGTGKSQTIVNLIASLAAEGKSTLFVAEKRAAIDAVLSRLDRLGLGDLVLDAYDGPTNKRATAQQFAKSLDAAVANDTSETGRATPRGSGRGRGTVTTRGSAPASSRPTTRPAPSTSRPATARAGSTTRPASSTAYCRNPMCQRRTRWRTGSRPSPRCRASARPSRCSGPRSSTSRSRSTSPPRRRATGGRLATSTWAGSTAGRSGSRPSGSCAPVDRRPTSTRSSCRPASSVSTGSSSSAAAVVRRSRRASTRGCRCATCGTGSPGSRADPTGSPCCPRSRRPSTSCARPGSARSSTTSRPAGSPPTRSRPRSSTCGGPPSPRRSPSATRRTAPTTARDCAATSRSSPRPTEPTSRRPSTGCAPRSPATSARSSPTTRRTRRSCAPGRWFDVVIFDEASQVQPAQAISAISRARQVVVAGDERQLPPTNFFTVVSDDESDATAPADETLTEGFESVLDVLAAALPTRNLTWHYRSRDERLIAFANDTMYDGRLTTFPGTSLDSAVTFEPVDGQAVVQPGVDTIETTDGEVARVVELVLDHARTRPTESLGVIALGIRHADRLEEAITGALRTEPDVAAFFDDSRDERFFVKNLERVQGDERDAIILSIGYGKTPHGRVLHRFGPLNIEGGERRLNVAITRARARMTVVSALRAIDLDPERLKARGALMLRDFLAYAERRGGVGDDDTLFASAPTTVDPLRHDLAERLRRQGLTVHEDYGTATHRIDIAVEDPYHRGRALIAVETDGSRYAALRSTRDRDRLRPEQLGRLGWVHERVWSTDVFRDPARELARIVTLARTSSPPVAAQPTSSDADATGQPVTD